MRPEIIFNKFGLLGLCFIVIFIFITCKSIPVASQQEKMPQPEYKVPEKLNDQWETASLQAANGDSEKIVELIRYIDILNNEKNNKNRIDGVLLVRGGKLILEKYFAPYNREKTHEIKSVTKSIASILTGIAIDKGFIENVNERIYTYLKTYKPEYEWDEREKRVTLKDLLTMTSGYDCDDQKDFKCQIDMQENSDDFVKYALDLDMRYEPGDHWAYNSSSLMLVEEIIMIKTNMPISDFAKKYLFQPLGVEDKDFVWSPAKNEGRVRFYGGAKMKPRAMAKFAYMVLNNGKWQGKQVVSTEWIKKSTKNHKTTNRNYQYGFLWWRGRAVVNNQTIKAFWAAGFGGQRIFIIPELDLIAIFIGKLDPPRGLQTHGMLISYIIPAFLAQAPKRNTINLDSDTIQKFNGKYLYRQTEETLYIESEGAKLFIKPPKWDGKEVWSRVEMFPETERQFFGTSKQLGNILVNFILNNDGKVSHLVVDFALTRWRCDKVR